MTKTLTAPQVRALAYLAQSATHNMPATIGTRRALLARGYVARMAGGTSRFWLTTAGREALTASPLNTAPDHTAANPAAVEAFSSDPSNVS